jgi:hypothetical protein
MKVIVHGPNLNDQSKGSFRAHAASCRDNRWETTRNGSHYPLEMDADSVEQIALAIYPPSDFQYDASDQAELDSYIADIYACACLKALPTSPEQHIHPTSSNEGDTTMSTETTTQNTVRKIVASEVKFGDLIATAKKGPYREVRMVSPGQTAVRFTFLEGARIRPQLTTELWISEPAQAEAPAVEAETKPAAKKTAAKKAPAAKKAAPKADAKKRERGTLENMPKPIKTKAAQELVKKYADTARWPRRNRATGTTVGIFDNRDGRFNEVSDSKWLAACIDHGTLLPVANCNLGGDFLSLVEHWCPAAAKAAAAK